MIRKIDKKNLRAFLLKGLIISYIAEGLYFAYQVPLDLKIFPAFVTIIHKYTEAWKLERKITAYNHSTVLRTELILMAQSIIQGLIYSYNYSCLL